MRPRERRETGEQDLFRSRLDQIIDMSHALVKLARAIDWRVLEERFGSVYTDGPGSPPLPTRLMAGIAILKYMHDLSDGAVCDCGEEFFQHRLAFDRSSLTRWRQRIGEEKLQALLQESLAVATRTEAMKPSDLARVVIDTTVQPKAVMFPTDAKLMNRAREILVRLAKRCGVELRQSYARVGKLALIKHQRYAHAHQFKRANKALRKLRTYLGRVIRDIGRRIEGNDALQDVFARPMSLARRVRDQDRHQRGKVYSLHAPEVECIGKGKAHRPYEFGQGKRRDHPQAFNGRPIRSPCGGAACQPLRRPHARHRHSGHGADDWQHHRAGPHRRRIPRPQRATQSQVQGLHRRPEASRP
jgi:transposase, IS5 family